MYHIEFMSRNLWMPALLQGWQTIGSASLSDPRIVSHQSVPWRTSTAMEFADTKHWNFKVCTPSLPEGSVFEQQLQIVTCVPRRFNTIHFRFPVHHCSVTSGNINLTSTCKERKECSKHTSHVIWRSFPTSSTGIFRYISILVHSVQAPEMLRLKRCCGDGWQAPGLWCSQSWWQLGCLHMLPLQ